jgi:predicted MPP superfamily phosphohydrolase
MKGYTLTSKTKKNLRVLRLFLISMICAGIALSVAVIGFNYLGNRNFRETFYCVGSLKVNNKIRIIHMSDLHNCSYGKDNAKIIDRVKKLKPDLIIYTGDMIDSKSASNDRAVNLCKALADVAPSYYIYGNNEVEKYYDVALTQEELDKKFGFDDDNRDSSKLLEITDELTEELTSAGVTVLKNQTATVTIGETQVDIFGVLTSNPSSFWSYAGQEFGNYMYSNCNNLKITAFHEPFSIEEYTPDSWGDIMLAGHNHGGTIKVPLVGPLYTKECGILPERDEHYVYGRYEVLGSPLFISSGLENRNLFRINNQPEIAIVDINRF